MIKECEIIDECIACGSTELVPVLDLGIQPLANSYKKNADDVEQYFPLAINRCKHCFHVQLTHRVNPDLMFKDYLYVSGTTKTQLDYFDWFADFAAEKYGTKPTTILDIGCNDGSQLNSFQDKGATTYGVDPAENLFATSSQRHKVVCGYFTGKEFGHEKFDVITCQNAFAHNFNQLELLQNIRNVMHKDSLLFATYIETQKGLYTEKTYDDYAADCLNNVKQFAEIIREMRSTGVPVVGYGAPAKGNTLMNFAQEGPDFIIDDNPLKQGMFTPGNCVPIYGTDYLKANFENVDKLCIIPLAWNFFKEIKTRTKNVRPGKNDIFVRYFPEFKVEE